MAADHRFLKFILPTKWFEAVEASTKDCLIECPCGYKRDVWSEGGTRYKAFGNPRHKCMCPACEKSTWHTVRKKTDEEKEII